MSDIPKNDDVIIDSEESFSDESNCKKDENCCLNKEDENCSLNKEENFTVVPKVYLTPEEAEAQAKMETHNKLLQLGQELERKKAKEESFNNIYKNLEGSFDSVLPDFNLDMIDKGFDLDVYLNSLNKKNSFEILDKKEFYKLYVLFLMTNHKLNQSNKKNSELKSQIDDVNDQADEYIQQIESMEEEQKENNKKISERIIKLRQKCIDRRIIINRMWGLIAFLVYTTLVSLQSFIFQFNYLIVNILTPSLKLIFINLIDIIYNSTMFIVSYKILCGILIGFISVNLYLKFSEIKPIKKED